MTKTKNYNQWLVIDWKTGESRTRKSKPGSGDLNANELLAELNVDVSVPEVEVPTLAVEIDVPEPQVYQATVDAIDEADLPDWSEAANDAIADERERITSVERDGLPAITDELTTQALLNAPGRPPAEQVRQYVAERVRAVREEAVEA